MKIWEPTIIHEQPEIVLVDWRIYEIETPGRSTHRRMVGRELGQAWRISGPVVAFDFVAMKGRTKSGKIYQLRSQPEDGKANVHYFSYWCMTNKVLRWSDVSGFALGGL
jgi:hypothetical protein